MQTQSPNPHAPKIVWGALLFAQFLFYFIVAQNANAHKEATPLTPQTQEILYAMAIVNWFLAWLVFPKILAKAIAKAVQANAKENQTPNIHVGHVVPMMIVQWALFESVTLFGFVIAFSAVSPQLLLPCLAASVLGFFLTFPSAARVETLCNSVRSHLKAGFGR